MRGHHYFFFDPVVTGGGRKRGIQHAGGWRGSRSSRSPGQSGTLVVAGGSRICRAWPRRGLPGDGGVAESAVRLARPANWGWQVVAEFAEPADAVALWWVEGSRIPRSRRRWAPPSRSPDLIRHLLTQICYPLPTPGNCRVVHTGAYPPPNSILLPLHPPGRCRFEKSATPAPPPVLRESLKFCVG